MARFDSNAGKEVRHLLPRMSDNSDDCFSFCSEITLTINNVPKAVWPKLLPQLLSARAHKCISHLTLEECIDFEKVKSSILTSYRPNYRTYLAKFKSLKRTGSQKYLTFLNRLEERYKFYLESRKIDSFYALFDEIVKLQFLESLDSGVRSFVEARTPATAKIIAEAANIAYETLAVNYGRKKNHFIVKIEAL